MVRKNGSPKENEPRAKICELLQVSNISSTDNSRNGHSSKTLRTSPGAVDVAVPRDGQPGKGRGTILLTFHKNAHIIASNLFALHYISPFAGCEINSTN